jgi:hypothetical protein
MEPAGCPLGAGFATSSRGFSRLACSPVIEPPYFTGFGDVC